MLVFELGVNMYHIPLMDNRIKEFRTKAKLPMWRLAELVGSTQQQISRLERGERPLTDVWMVRLSKPLQCRPQDLIACDGDEIESNVVYSVDSDLMKECANSVHIIAKQRKDKKFSRDQLLDITVKLYNHIQKHRLQGDNAEPTTAVTELIFEKNVNSGE